jgi:urease accessory protein
MIPASTRPPSSTLRSLLLQLSDSAFPSGAFPHSFGLEALKQHGALEPLDVRLHELVWHTAYGALPFLDAAYADGPRADRENDVFLSNHIANRASRAQGQAFLLATRELFGPCELPFGHLAPAWGVVLARARVPLDDARHVFLFGAVRSALSAAVRLGAVGPLRAQRLLLDLHGVIEHALQEKIDAPCGVAPRLEAAQAAHDTLYSRLFQS